MPLCPILISLIGAITWRAGPNCGRYLDTFQDIIGPEHKKYLCAPCSNCKGQMREMFQAYGVFNKCNILYGGLVELIVNAMADIKDPFLTWEWR